MANSIIMPKTGMAMEEGIILEWKIKIGDKVAKGDVVALIETDKATMELESDYSGTILAILNQAGETVPVTKVIAWVGEAGEAAPQGGAFQADAAETRQSKAQDTPPAALPGAMPNNAASGAAAKAAGSASADLASAAIYGIMATPAARALAKERGIELNAIVPTGKFGEINKASVEAASVEATSVEATSFKAASAITSLPAGALFSSGSRNAGVTRADMAVPLTNIQKITGKRMAESRQTIPEVTAQIKADVTNMLLLREELNNSIAALGRPGKITINDFVLAAVVKALLAYPRLNSVLEGNNVIYKGNINLGMAAATKRGLVVPVIHNAHDYPLTLLSLKAAELAAKARDGTIKGEEMSGGTFTVSNIGMYGITFFTPVINQPEAAIIGVCAVEDQLKLEGEKAVSRKIMGLSLAYDHRIVDGAESSMFLKEIKDILESPLLILV